MRDGMRTHASVLLGFVFGFSRIRRQSCAGISGWFIDGCNVCWFERESCVRVRGRGGGELKRWRCDIGDGYYSIMFVFLWSLSLICFHRINPYSRRWSRYLLDIRTRISHIQCYAESLSGEVNGLTYIRWCAWRKSERSCESIVNRIGQMWHLQMCATDCNHRHRIINHAMSAHRTRHNLQFTIVYVCVIKSNQ